MRPGVVQVFALEPDLRADVLRKARRVAERRRATHVVMEHVVELAPKCRIVARGVVGPLQLLDGGDESFGDVPPAKGPKAVQLKSAHTGTVAARAASRKTRIRAWSLIPGADSTPDDTSTTSGAIA